MEMMDYSNAKEIIETIDDYAIVVQYDEVIELQCVAKVEVPSEQFAHLVKELYDETGRRPIVFEQTTEFDGVKIVTYYLIRSNVIITSVLTYEVKPK